MPPSECFANALVSKRDIQYVLVLNTHPGHELTSAGNAQTSVIMNFNNELRV